MNSGSKNFTSQTQLIECPRDAMQGWKSFIPTNKKIEYINALLNVGFDTIDFGSFVSPKAIPQMADTREVLKSLQVDKFTSSKLLVIVANVRGAEEAVAYDAITYLGFPFSISETFQQRNAKSSIEQSVGTVEEIQNLCNRHNKELIIYLSMAFGNPYEDAYNKEILLRWADEMVKKKIKIIALADTVGIANPEQISFALNTLISNYPDTTFGVHLHSTAENWKQKVEAAYAAGCKRFDGTLKGIGGCPMANDDLVGNMNTEWLLKFMEDKGEILSINEEALKESLRIAEEIFR
ncbi:MAG: hydroxymethylglutaryl-CoA lyase [Chitinophagaceae bacterium]